MELYPVSVDVLHDGMMVDYGIYYYHKDQPVLLCKDVVLTSGMIRSIKAAMSFSDNVYMDKKSRDRVLRETSYFDMAQSKVERKIGYDVMKKTAKSFVSDVMDKGIVSAASVKSISEEIGNKLVENDSALIMQCLNGVRSVDEYLYIHSLNVGFLNGLIAKWCGFDEEAIAKMIKIGLVHDIGKLKIPDEIINKPAKLTDEEYQLVKHHAEYSCQMLELSGETDPEVLDAVLHHHERINGKGYPHQLHNNQISVMARITAISDVYDAMTAAHPYKDASSPFVTLQELSDTSFSDLDMHYVKTLVENMPNELLGRQVLLSNGAVGTVEFIDKRRLRYPLVNVDGQTIKTDENIYCLKMYAG